MSRSRNWKLAAAGAAAGLAFAGAAVGLVAFGARAGPLMWSQAFGFAEPHDREAYRLVAGGRAGAAPDPAAAAEIGRALHLSPYNNAARLRLVYLQSRNTGRLTPETLALYAQSYDLAPFDYTVAAWRVGFGLEHWSALTPELRAAVQSEALAFRKAGSHEVGMRDVMEHVHDPAGRLAASLWSRTLAH